MVLNSVLRQVQHSTNATNKGEGRCEILQVKPMLITPVKTITSAQKVMAFILAPVKATTLKAKAI